MVGSLGLKSKKIYSALLQVVPDSLEWAHLVCSNNPQEQNISIGQLIDMVCAPGSSANETSQQQSSPTDLYLHDWSLPQRAPHMLNDFVVPR
jgi:hypothetical protein